MLRFILQDVQIDRMYIFRGNSGIRLTLLSVLFLAHCYSSLDYTRQTLFRFTIFTFSVFIKFLIIILTFTFPQREVDHLVAYGQWGEHAGCSNGCSFILDVQNIRSAWPWWSPWPWPWSSLLWLKHSNIPFQFAAHGKAKNKALCWVKSEEKKQTLKSESKWRLQSQRSCLWNVLVVLF